MNTLQLFATDSGEFLFLGFLSPSITISLLVAYIVWKLIKMGCAWGLMKKSGYQGWEAVVPIYGHQCICKIAHVEPVWMWVSTFFPFANFYVYIRLANAFAKDSVWGIGLFFLPPIFFAILSYGSAEKAGLFMAAGESSYGKPLYDGQTIYSQPTTFDQTLKRIQPIQKMETIYQETPLAKIIPPATNAEKHETASEQSAQPASGSTSTSASSEPTSQPTAQAASQSSSESFGPVTDFTKMDEPTVPNSSVISNSPETSSPSETSSASEENSAAEAIEEEDDDFPGHDNFENFYQTAPTKEVDKDGNLKVVEPPKELPPMLGVEEPEKEINLDEIEFPKDITVKG